MKITYEADSIEIKFEEGDTAREGRVIRSAIEFIRNLIFLIRKR